MFWRGYHLIAVSALILLSNQGVSCLRLKEVKIPRHIARDQKPTLECSYDLEGEALYSVKWYKDGHEFFRYVPGDKPPAQVFDLPGVAVEMNKSTESQVNLKPVSLASTGRYRCEVSAEAPSFQTVTDQGDMVVVALPEGGPRISGGRPRYQINDSVRVNCSSGHSKPAATLTWFINGEQADPSFLRGPETSVTDRDGLETTYLGLEFRVRAKHFKRGDMKLKCLATIETVYWQTNEESVQGDKPQKAPAMPIVTGEHMEGSPSKSRADRVQASGHTSQLMPSSLLLTTLLVLLAASTSR